MAGGSYTDDINTTNVFFAEDNAVTLKRWFKRNLTGVDVVYLDPPYNTGKTFNYSDNREPASWSSWLADVLYATRGIMNPSGVLFMSIGQQEVHTLRGVLDDVFGVENFVAQFVWLNNLKGRQLGATGPAVTHEYVLCYSKCKSRVRKFTLPTEYLNDTMPLVYPRKESNYQILHDDLGPFVLKNQLYNTNRRFNEDTAPTMVFDIYYEPTTGRYYTDDVSNKHKRPGCFKVPPRKNGNGANKYHAWRWSRKRVEEDYKNLFFRTTPGRSLAERDKSGYGTIWTKVRDVDHTRVKDIITDIATSEGQADLRRCGIHEYGFDAPKPARLIELLLYAATYENPTARIADLFAGSGTTAHAVASLNRRDGGRRTWLLTQLPETDSRTGRPISDFTVERLQALQGLYPEIAETGPPFYTWAAV